MLRWIVGILFCVNLAACTGASDLGESAAPLGDFNLEHNIVVAPKAVKGPVSRTASKDELSAAMKKAIAERFDRYTGDRRYHFGVSIEGYVLAQPGIPVVLAPKSVLIINLTVWDDAAQKKLNTKPHQITVLETFGKGAIVGTGYTLTAEEQLENLAQNASKAIERYLVKQHKDEGWFKPAE